MSPEDRAHEGIFLSFQAPVEIPGVSMVNFMRAAVNEQRKYRHLPALSASEFLKLMREKRAIVELDNKLANRSVNEGFSGGERSVTRYSRWRCWNRLLLFGRDGFRIGCGCFAYCGRRFQQTQDCGNQCYGHYPLPAVVGLYQTRYGTCTAGWTYRKDRWTGIGEGD